MGNPNRLDNGEHGSEESFMLRSRQIFISKRTILIATTDMIMNP